jgi:hypothetical protein
MLLGPTGIMIGGEKYMTVGSEKDVVLRGKKVISHFCAELKMYVICVTCLTFLMTTGSGP